MKIRLDEIPQKGLTIDIEEKPSKFPEWEAMAKSTGYEFKTPIAVSMHLKKIGGKVEINGRLQGRFQFVCSRCAGSFETDITSQFRFFYDRQPERPTSRPGKKEIQLTAEDVGLMFYADDVVDTDQAIMEEVLTAVPVRPLCSAECKGLCHRCGADLNLASCRCEPAGDPRFRVLKQLEDLKDQTGKKDVNRHGQNDGEKSSRNLDGKHVGNADG